VNTGDLFPEPSVAQERVLHYQRKLHAWASQHHAICPWSAGCGGSRTSGAEGGGEETTGRKADTGASPSTLPPENPCGTGALHMQRCRPTETHEALGSRDSTRSAPASLRRIRTPPTSPRQSPASGRAQTRCDRRESMRRSRARFRPGAGSQLSRTLGLRNVTGRCSASASALLPPTASRRALSGSHPSAPGCRSMMSTYSPTTARGGCAPRLATSDR